MILTVVALIVLALASYRFIVSAANIIWWQKLPPYNPTMPQMPVSVLIPARNEAVNIARLLSDLARQSYPPVEIIVCDDHSTDDTASVVARFTAEYPHIHIFRSAPLPEGWTGKNFACHQLAGSAQGRYLLFVDADVRLGRNAVGRALEYASSRQLGLLSVFPRQQMPTSGEKATVPLMNLILLTLLPLVLVRKAVLFPSLSAANGQFMMFSNQAYKHLQPHLKVRGQRVEDVAIARLFKTNRIKTAVLTGDSDINCRMYRHGEEAVNGFAKNISAFFFNSYPLTVLFWLITTFGFIPVFISCPPAISVTYIIIAVATRIQVSVVSRQPVLINLLYWGKQQYCLGKIIFRSLTGRIKNTMQWKGRNI